MSKREGVTASNTFKSFVPDPHQISSNPTLNPTDKSTNCKPESLIFEKTLKPHRINF